MVQANIAQSFLNFLEEVDGRERAGKRDKVRTHVASQMARICITTSWHA